MTVTYSHAKNHGVHPMEMASIVLAKCFPWNHTEAKIGNGWSQFSDTSEVVTAQNLSFPWLHEARGTSWLELTK